MFEPDEKNENWTRYWGIYTWLPDADLGELEIPEPPLSHQVEPEELDLFIESCVHTENEAADRTEHSQDASSTLVGAWSGTYEYQRGNQGDGLVSLSITEHKDGQFRGSGIDAIGAFTVDGTIVDNKVIFTKSYTDTDTAWKYVGFMDTEMANIVGRWGPQDMEDDVPPLSAVEGGNPVNHPGEKIDGNGPETNSLETNGLEERESSEQAPQCDIEITVEGPNGTPGEEKGGEAMDGGDAVSEAGVSEAGSAISSIQTDAAEVLVIRGTFSLVRRPVDYFLYRPSDAEFQESRPKALWKMARNAAEDWYRSRHLTWDTLRERRDRRNRYTELLRKREAQGMLYDSDEVTEWATIIQQTHPNDLRLWRAIAHFKEKRMVSHWYVHLISHVLLSNQYIGF